MKKFLALCAVLALGVFVLNGFVTLASNQDSFWNEAAQAGMAEVNLANLALQKSQNEEVKQLAQKVVDDHTAANNELKDLAASKKVTLATDVSAKQKAAYDKLNGLSGDQFDMEFIKTMVKDHESAVSLFQKQADSGKDAEVKAFAAKTLPTLQGHLEMAKSLNDKMKGMKNPKKSDDSQNMNSNSNPDDKNMNSNTNPDDGKSMNSNTNSDNMDMNSNGSKDMNSNTSFRRNRNVNSNPNMSNNSNPNINSMN
jgi:putative membrane protein